MPAASYNSRATEAIRLARSAGSLEERSDYLEIAERWCDLAGRTGRSRRAERVIPPDKRATHRKV